MSLVFSVLRFLSSELADLVHGVGQEVADDFVAVGRDGADLGDVFDLGGHLGDGFDGLVNGGVYIWANSWEERPISLAILRHRIGETSQPR